MDDPGAPPPIIFDDPDERVFGHLSELVDGVTREAVTTDTRLVGLHQGDQLLTNLTSVSEPKVMCRFSDSAGVLLGRINASRDDTFRLKVTFNKLLLAPSVRLECVFLRPRTEDRRHTVSIDFHFHDFSAADTGIQSFCWKQNTMTFTAKGASCSGFNKTQVLGAEEELILFTLKSLISPSVRQLITIKLNDQYLDDAQKSALAAIRARLPGGNGHLLPSLGSTTIEYAMFGGSPGRIVSGIGQMRYPRDLMVKAPRHPMVPLPSSDTFRTMKEAAVEMAYSCTTLFAEESEALDLWASELHTGTLFKHGKFIIVAVNFYPNFPKLGCRTNSIQYRLPKNLSCKLCFRIPGKNQLETFSGLLMSNVAGLPTHYDAYFAVVSKEASHFNPVGRPESLGTADVFTETSTPSTKPFDLRCIPKQSEFTYTSQLETISDLQEKKNKRWRAVLLNQLHDALEAQDLTQNHGVSQHLKAEADEWLMNFMVWNQEQLGVIRGIKAAQGGFVIVMGPAGTGKTLLQLALACYFWYAKRASLAPQCLRLMLT